MVKRVESTHQKWFEPACDNDRLSALPFALRPLRALCSSKVEAARVCTHDKEMRETIRKWERTAIFGEIICIKLKIEASIPVVVFFS